MIILPDYFLMWKRANGARWSIDRYQKAHKKRRDIERAIDKTGIVKNTHQPFHKKNNPRSPVEEHQGRVVAWSITKKKYGNYAGDRPKRK